MYNKIVKYFLIVVGLYHLAVGVLGSLSSDIAREVVRVGWKTDILFSPQTEIIIKFLAAYMIGFGCCVLLVAFNTHKYKNFLLVFFAFTFIELIQTVILIPKLQSVLKLSFNDILFNVTISIIIQIGFVLSFYYTGKLKKSND